MELILRAAATADLEEAHDWYETQRPGLGEEFLAGVHECLERIREAPTRYPVIHRDTRRVLLRRFPYSILYRLIRGKVVVVAIFHGRRDPRTWKSRR